MLSLPKVSFPQVRRLLLGIFLISIVFALGFSLGVNGFRTKVEESYKVRIERETPPDKNVDFKLFWKVWDILATKYFDKSKLLPSEMVYGSISGMVSALGDPYTVFLSPRENKVVDEDLSGSFEGVGIQIGFKGTRLAVIAPLPGSPAEKAGVKAGDYIIHIKDPSKEIDIGTVGITLPDAVAAIRGKSGSKVTLTLLREGAEAPIEAELTRAKLEVPSVVLKYVGENSDIAHIKVNKFSSETVGEWGAVQSEILKNAKVASLIIDLRNNPGGYLQAAVDLASEFLGVGKVVVIEEKANGARNEFKVEKIGKLQNYEVVILVNEGSASASEILAGALRDQKKIKIIGKTTFGKGTIQEPIEIEGGSGLHVTTAKWLTPNGTWVHTEGLKPDLEAEDNIDTTEDEQLQEAVKYLISN